MTDTKLSQRLILAALFLTGAIVFCAGITWGLPSRNIDRYLFGDHEVWTGRKILELAGDRPEEGSRGADVDATPIMRSAGPVLLNGTDPERARILIRYRLYTYQPDEMITMMSLARMKPAQRDFDPRLYQYGGFWIYSVGGLLALAGKLGLIHLTHDLSYYLDHPEAFGRFYIVARAYSAAWGLIGIWAVYWITRRMTCFLPPLPRGGGGGSEGREASISSKSTSSSFKEPNANRPPDPPLPPLATASLRLVKGGSAPLAAALCFLFLPVVINMAHEAKPHLPAAVLMLYAVIAATRYVEAGTARWWIATGILCGVSFGTVLSALPVFVILPLMILLRTDPALVRLRRFVGAGLLGIAAYGSTNPYILINGVKSRDVLLSNLHNSTAMYGVGGWNDSIRNAAYLLAEAASPILMMVAFITAAALLALRSDRIRSAMTATRRDIRVVCAVLLAAPALLVLVQFTILAAGKPGEYGRFLVYPTAVLAIAAVIGIQILQPVRARFWNVLLVATTLVFGARYLYAFILDASTTASRLRAAQVLASRHEKRLIVRAESAPYIMPPVDLFNRQLLLDREASAPQASELLVLVPDEPQEVRLHLPPDTQVIWPLAQRSRPMRETVISWADKPILILGPDNQSVRLGRAILEADYSSGTWHTPPGAQEQTLCSMGPAVASKIEGLIASEEGIQKPEGQARLIRAYLTIMKHSGVRFAFSNVRGRSFGADLLSPWVEPNDEPWLLEAVRSGDSLRRSLALELLLKVGGLDSLKYFMTDSQAIVSNYSGTELFQRAALSCCLCKKLHHPGCDGLLKRLRAFQTKPVDSALSLYGFEE